MVQPLQKAATAAKVRIIVDLFICLSSFDTHHKILAIRNRLPSSSSLTVAALIRMVRTAEPTVVSSLGVRRLRVSCRWGLVSFLGAGGVPLGLSCVLSLLGRVFFLALVWRNEDRFFL